MLDSRVLIAVALAVAVVAAAASLTSVVLVLRSASGGGAVNPPAYLWYGDVARSSYSHVAPGMWGANNTIAVTGTATTYVIPSRVKIYVAVETVVPVKDAVKAYSNVTSRASKLIDSVKAVEGVLYVQTTGISLNPSYDYTEGRRVFRGYVATYSLVIEASVESAGKVIAEAVKAEADAIKGITLTASDEELEAAKEEVLRKAVENAYAKAEIAAKALNTSVGRALHVSIGYSTPRMEVARVGSYVAKVPEAPIEVGKGFAVTATVNIVFEIGR